MRIIKRNGSEEEFNIEKIVNAVKKAMNENKKSIIALSLNVLVAFLILSSISSEYVSLTILPVLIL